MSETLDRSNLASGSGMSTQPQPRTAPADHSRFCPNCSSELMDHRCKLKCPQCGFYLSCSDFY